MTWFALKIKQKSLVCLGDFGDLEYGACLKVLFFFAQRCFDVYDAHEVSRSVIAMKMARGARKN